MKKMISILCVFAMMLTIVVGAGAAEYKEGTYSASAAGRNGEVTVSVTFSNTAITGISVESEETPTIGAAAMDELAQTVLNTQTIPADAVSGATVSSDAFVSALRDCITQAGADPDSMRGEAAEETAEEYVTEADVIVVGAGGAGLSASVTAAQAGATVILLEKSNIVGGNTLMTMAGINAVDSKVQLADEEYQAQDTSAEAFKALHTHEGAHEELIDAYAANSGELIDWVSDMGVEFEVKITQDPRNELQNYWMLYSGGNFETAMHIVTALDNQLKQEENISLYLNIDATELLTDDNGAVIGVKAVNQAGEEIEFYGKKVILATGGYCANPDIYLQYIPEWKNAVIGVNAPTTGEGLEMATAVGAVLVDMDQIQPFGHTMVGYGLVTPPSTAFPGGNDIDCIFVNQDAERFAQEGSNRTLPNDVILANEKSFCIFDDSGMNDFMAARVAGGYVQEADSVRELAENLGLDPDKLEASVAAYNEDIADGVDDAFAKDPVQPIDGQKYYGYQFGLCAHYCMGGILINENTEVVYENGTAIPNLYAAGEVTGGFHGVKRIDGSGDGDAFVFGRIAGRNASAAALAA